MPLPIPEIMQNAAAVLRAARDMGYTPTEEQSKTLHHLSKTVNADDLMAVLNKIAGIFQWMNNIQIQSIGSAPDFQNKKFALGMALDCPLGDRQLTIPLTIDQARELIKTFQDTLNALIVTEGKLILDAGSA